MASPGNSDLEIFESDYSNFVSDQINSLLNEERTKNEELSQVDELKIAIEFCKNYLSDTSSVDDARRVEVMDKLVELRLELVHIQDCLAKGEMIERTKRYKGHIFVVQPAQGRNPYCDICLQTIWRVAQRWRRCSVCGMRSHDKCLEEATRPCAGLIIKQKNFALNLDICPEVGLLAQEYKCHECTAPIGFGKDGISEARICDYTGRYYCTKCHWNDLSYIPARLVRNFDSVKRPICRATKQLLTLVEHKPIINLAKANPALFTYVNGLKKIHHIRTKIMFMKCYFMSCKVNKQFVSELLNTFCRKARKLRILQYLARYQHFVETDYMWSMLDLVQTASGTMVQEVESIFNIFLIHITKECETCKGKAFICELCRVNKVIFPFDDEVSICKTCLAVFHANCFGRVSKRCPRCLRRCNRNNVSAIEEDGRSIQEKTADSSTAAQQ
ncbi:C1 domain containing protein [Aphelenchoides bicaudatus]|nr:C1 domain containing protein [Aphelenchoides bicaudatus]